MPKQIYKIDRFEGGLNSNADPRDIADNELSSAFDLMVDELGTIRTIGGATAHPSETGAGSTVHANEITPGYGLFAWKSDRTAAQVRIADYNGAHDASDDGTTPDLLTDSGQSIAVDALIGATVNNVTDGSSGIILDNNATTISATLAGGSDNSWDNADVYKITDIPTTGESYLSFSDADETGTVMIYGMGSDSWDSPIIGQGDQTGGTRKDVFYAVDGNLRICDAEFRNTNENKWHGYVDKIFLSSLSGDEVTYDYWTTQSQYIATPNSNSAFDQTIASTGVTPGDIETRTSAEVDIADNNSGVTSSGGSQQYFESDAVWAAATGTVANIYKLTVQVQIAYSDVTDAFWNYTLTGGDATNSTTFAGSLGTNHKSTTSSDLGASEGGDVVTETHVFTFSNPATNTPLTSGATTAGVRVLLDGVTIGSDVTSVSIHTVQVQEAAISSASAHSGAGGSNISNSDIFGEFNFSEPAAGKAIGWDRKWEHGFTFIYDGTQESLVRRVKDVTTTSTDTDGSTLLYTYEQAVTDATYSPDTRISIKYDDTWNPRLTVAVWYVRDISGDVPSKWWGQVEYNFVNATSKVLASGKEFTATKNAATGELNFDVDQEYLLQPNQVDTYRSRNGFSEDNESITSRYKTAVQVGRRMYIGNVKIINEDGTTEVKGDAMLKSPVNRFDTFPVKSTVEAAINDGESITALEEFADRILQFKEETLYIINVSQDIEFLEDVYKYKGVLIPAAVCKTDYGCAWVNRLGCYLYDGKQVINLLEKGGRQMIKESDWLSFTTDNSIIGYIPKKRQLLVLKDCSGSSVGDIYLYDMVTQSWVQGNSALTDSQEHTNFVNDSNGDLVWAHTSDTGTMTMWSDGSAAKGGLVLTTKDIDFGEPGRNKKLYKVLITYTTAASGSVASVVTVKYDTNGTTTFDKTFANGTNFSSNVLGSADGWQVAELKPTTSSQANNIKSFALKFSTAGTVPAGFKINDISCVYRGKPVR